MAIRLSSALRDAVMLEYGLGLLLQYGHIQLRTGTQPASADAAATGDLLAVITQNGLPVPTLGNNAGGLLLQGSSTPGQLMKRGTWIMNASGIGAFGWWRWVVLGDNADALSTTARRMDGLAGESFDPDELPAMLPGVTATISDFSLLFPANT
jgi:hypothetical protein